MLSRGMLKYVTSCRDVVVWKRKAAVKKERLEKLKDIKEAFNMFTYASETALFRIHPCSKNITQ